MSDAEQKNWLELVGLGHTRETTGYKVSRPWNVDNLLIIHTLSGSGWAGEPSNIVQAGDTLVFTSQSPQHYGIHSDSHWEIRWAHVKPRARWTPWLDWPTLEQTQGVKITRGPSYAGRISQALQDALEFSRVPIVEAEALAMTRIEEALLWNRARCGENPPIDERLQPALLQLTRDPKKKLSIAALAKKCHLSPSRFAHLFSEHVGLPPHRFQEQIRLRMASDLLRLTNQPIQQIAERCGYDDPLYFSRRFKILLKTSPKKYRENASPTS